MQDFWKTLPKPFFALAPMEDVTDAAFRALIARVGKPHVMMTEFTSADGLVHANESGLKKLKKKLKYTESERPIVVQLFTAHPHVMERIALMCAELGFDGIDINMGCPVDEVVRQECGAALIKNPKLAGELIVAAKRSGLPVSVKTRIGFNTDQLDEWLPELLKENPSAITIHARTRKEMSDVPAHWERVARAVAIRDESGSDTLIIGNGDVKDIADAHAKIETTKCDGVMLGRAIYGNPWLFLDRENAPSPEEKKIALAEHLKLFDEHLIGTTNYAVMKKHFKAYISGWDGAKELRIKLMETESVNDALALLVDNK